MSFWASARHWKHFEVKGEDYLIVANGDNTSRLYHWDGVKFQLREIIDTTGGAFDWNFMQVGEQTYLMALANTHDLDGFHGNSEIFRFE
ncbi:hypothetical protein COW36_10340 [bacterium (Candidatus Blackallbacteria) CG17_big_fil_post_rev_8_21_14_2_50_48_46]|uniref:Uncharacterized protein n=1 Tax=bacterium (Candidatus Blackallbacteria) CG17_big_fil_post_rev_8_21_14_2_50_48_46 TaxID=2014261 RepID=A0A2M7G568_9BACT|nr:MAG: hypothetical protein COW64_20110 [bacterium (Candidatus Blackallbacteria) CG18_big_fil_WC_8_21_14_2_50_49_26]PIW17083.1 MAG: hypothetical protein COW36_10340 [bacterium (Candidatus Blackallbacteria) CG17_big_fil_post_rev_8_21_14_2_50_48_46]PIW48160.1 MAG: hypothetical protein COW20_10335 [bacterium (Candidatus Blackallbacteria) CG13_big_fil_rev_8_21_14_2_50_49_14]